MAFLKKNPRIIPQRASREEILKRQRNWFKKQSTTSTPKSNK